MRVLAQRVGYKLRPERAAPDTNRKESSKRQAVFGCDPTGVNVICLLYTSDAADE